MKIHAHAERCVTPALARLYLNCADPLQNGGSQLSSCTNTLPPDSRRKGVRVSGKAREERFAQGALLSLIHSQMEGNSKESPFKEAHYHEKYRAGYDAKQNKDLHHLTNICIF